MRMASARLIVVSPSPVTRMRGPKLNVSLESVVIVIFVVSGAA